MLATESTKLVQSQTSLPVKSCVHSRMWIDATKSLRLDTADMSSRRGGVDSDRTRHRLRVIASAVPIARMV